MVCTRQRARSDTALRLPITNHLRATAGKRRRRGPARRRHWSRPRGHCRRPDGRSWAGGSGGRWPSRRRSYWLRQFEVRRHPAPLHIQGMHEREVAQGRLSVIAALRLATKRFLHRPGGAPSSQRNAPEGVGRGDCRYIHRIAFGRQGRLPDFQVRGGNPDPSRCVDSFGSSGDLVNPPWQDAPLRVTS